MATVLHRPRERDAHGEENAPSWKRRARRWRTRPMVAVVNDYEGPGATTTVRIPLAISAVPIRGNCFASWPGYWLGVEGIVTPDIARFRAEIDLLYVEGRGPIIGRKSGPTRPAHLPPLRW